MPSFSDRLKILRKFKNNTQKEMGNILNINERNYRRYEAGEVDPTNSVLTTLADYFNVSIDYLTGRSDDPTRH